MSAARNNPMSRQYRGSYPEETEVASIEMRRGASPEWIAAHPDAQITGEEPGDEDIIVYAMLTVKRIEPSNLSPGQPEKWPQSEDVVLGPLLFWQADQIFPARFTLENFRALTKIKTDVISKKEDAS